MTSNDMSKLTGIPQLVDIPAPVITTIFRDFASKSAIAPSSPSESDVTFVVGMAAVCG